MILSHGKRPPSWVLIGFLLLVVVPGSARAQEPVVNDEMCLATGATIPIFVSGADTLVGPGRVPIEDLRAAGGFAGLYAEGMEFFEQDQPIFIEPDVERRSYPIYQKFGMPRRLDCAGLRRVETQYVQVPVFVASDAERPYETLYLPVRPDVWQGYERGVFRTRQGGSEFEFTQLFEPDELATTLAAAAAPDEAIDSAWVVVEVLYGENRLGESHERDDELAVGRLAVSVPFSHRVGELDRPKWWEFGWIRPDPTRSMMIWDSQQWGREALADSVRARLEEQGGEAEVLVFIHGFNTSFDEAALRTAQIAYDLRFGGVAAFFSWPSRGRSSPSAYLADREEADAAVPHLSEFLELVTTGADPSQVHLIAHGLGARLLADAIPDMPGNARFNQIVLAAPDIDAGTFEQIIAPKIRGSAGRVTLYSSSQDRGLRIAHGLTPVRRAGDSEPSLVLVDGIDTIDASAIDTDLLGDPSLAMISGFLADLTLIIRNGLAPDRRVLEGPFTEGGVEYWRLRR